MKKTFRLVAKTYHIWTGLSIGLLFCLMGLSGSVILYRDAIESALRPQWKAARQAHPASVLDAGDANIRQRWPGAARNRITFPREAGAPYEYQIRVDGQPVHVYVDAKTGEILGTWEIAWLDWITGFHQNLRLPPAGRQWVGAIGIVLFLSSASGLLIWLLRNPAWKGMFRIGWKASLTKLSFDVHRSLGLAANVFLLVLSVTGICLGFPDTYRTFSEMVTGTSMARPPRITVASSEMSMPLDAYVQAGLAAIPGGVARELRFPQGKDRPATVRIWHAGDYREDGSNQVSVDPATARVVGVDAAAIWTLARKVSSAPAPIHYAEWGGPVVKVLWCLTGLMPTVLFVSGVYFWLTGFRARRKAANAGRGAAQPVLAHV